MLSFIKPELHSQVNNHQYFMGEGQQINITAGGIIRQNRRGIVAAKNCALKCQS